MSTFTAIFNKTGRATAKAGRFVGHKVAEAYLAIDPDLRRHVAQVPLLSYSLFASRPKDVEPGLDDGHRPLILVHGMGGNSANFRLLSLYLRLHGRRRTYSIHFEGGTRIETMAAELAVYVHRVLQVNGADQVDLVAHSMGGVVARLALCEHGLADQVHTLITLGSPHAGTVSARFGDTPNIRDLRPNSAMMKRLQAEPWPAQVRGVTFFSNSDLFVLPAESAAVKGTLTVDASPFTHYSYLFDPRGFAAVVRALDGLDVGPTLRAS